MHPTHLVQKIWPWKRHLILLVGHLLQQVWAICQELYQMTFVLDIGQKICLQRCSYLGIFLPIETLSEIFLDAPSGLFHWFCGELMVVISMKYYFGILFTMANYVMHIPGIFYCKWKAWSRQWTGSGGDHRLSTVGLPGSSDGVYTSGASNDHMTAVQCKETW